MAIVIRKLIKHYGIMKKLVNLAEQMEFDYKNCKYDIVKRNKTENGYTITFIKNPLPSINNLSFSEKKILLKTAEQKNENFREIGYVIKYTSNNNIFFGIYNKIFREFGKKIWVETNWLETLSLENNKIIKKNISDGLVKMVLFYLGLECLSNENEKNYLISDMFTHCTPLLKGILKQKITNFNEALTVYLSSTYGLKRNDSKITTLKRLLHCEETRRHSKTGIKCRLLHKSIYIIDILEFASSLNDVEYFMREYRNCEYENSNTPRYQETEERLLLFRDLLEDAKILDIKVNPKWSLKRMREEHERNTDKIMLLTKGALETEQIHQEIDTEINDDIKGKIINSEYDTYKEASYMHHCLYNHYYKQIQDKQYLALSITYPERCTVGIRHQKTGFEIEQIHTIRNGNVSKETRELINSYFKAHKEWFDSLYKPSEKEKQTNQDTFPVQMPVPVNHYDEEDIPF